jgi:ketopantoate reductase
MTCGIFGPGLVGSYLGAAAGSPWVVPGPSGQVRATRVRLPSGVREWNPRLLTSARETLPSERPMLVASRVHQTPWNCLPLDALCAQNGLGQARAVAVCFFAVDRDDDGVLHATGPVPRVVVGRLGRRWEPVLAAWRAAGLQVDEVADVAPAQWEKTILNATVGPLCLATGLGMAGVWAEPQLRELAIAATGEGLAIAAATGIAIPEGAEQRAAAFFAAVGGHRPSVVRDAGELPAMLGHLLRSARAAQVPAPSLASIAARVDAARAPLAATR